MTISSLKAEVPYKRVSYQRTLLYFVFFFLILKNEKETQTVFQCQISRLIYDKNTHNSSTHVKAATVERVPVVVDGRVIAVLPGQTAHGRLVHSAVSTCRA